MSAALPKAKPWYDYPVYSDYPWSDYHNTDVGTPADVPLTAPLAGKVTALGYYDWGGQVTVQADNASQIGGHPYYFMIHLDALNPALHTGSRVNQGDFLGYSGGQTSNAGLPALPAGYTHHVTLPSHSTGPHLDIGVADTPQGSIDASKQWSDALVSIAQNNRIPYSDSGGNAGQTNGPAPQSLSPCSICAAIPVTARPAFCLACSGSSASSDWSQWMKLLARGGFMLLGGAFILAGGYLAVKSLGETTGATEKIKETGQKVQAQVQRAAAAVATEGASEAGRAAGKGSKSKKPAPKETKKAPAPAKKAA